MAMIKAKELRDKSDDELEDELRSKKKEIFELRSQATAGKEQKVHLIKQRKTEIARILTVKRERVKS